MKINVETINTKRCEDTLNNYIKVGKDLQKNPTPFIKSLNDVIKKREESQMIKKETACMDKDFKDSLFMTMNESFISLISPSLTGKTQAAFAISSKIPLYFVFDQEQFIYRPFDRLSSELENFALADMPVMKRSLEKTGKVIDRNFPVIQRDDFRKLTHVKSKVIGYLKALIEDAEAFHSSPAETRGEWFIHFTRNRQFKFKEMSINEFEIDPISRTFIDKYFVFMDEFLGKPEFVYLRNLFRFLKISCIVSSTNSKVVNLLGKSTRTSSRSDGPRAWCLAFPKPSPISLNSIETNYEFIRCAQNAIKKAYNISEMEGDKMKNVVNYLKDQCSVCRPGLAIMIMNNFVEICEKEAFLSDELFENVFTKVQSQLVKRKEQAFLGVNSSEANAYIMLSCFFNNQYSETKDDNYLRTEELIDRHFFYLTTPNSDDQPFLLSRHANVHEVEFANDAEDDCTPTIVYGPDVKKFTIDGYFDVQETLLMLSCLYDGLKHPAYAFTKKAVTPRFWDSFNDFARKRCGDFQENLALISFCDSSHKTLRGTKAVDFIKGVIWHFNRDRPYMAINIKLHDSRIGKSLEKISVPFLLPLNYNIPESFPRMFPKGHSSIHFGTYCSTKNMDQIDAVFDLIPESKSDFKKSRCIVEAKNRKIPIGGSEFHQIIERAVKYSEINSDTDFPLHITFTSGIRKLNADSQSSTELRKLASDHKINFITLKPFVDDELYTNLINFEITSLSNTGLPLFSDPKMTSLVIDIDMINDHFKKLWEFAKKSRKEIQKMKSRK